eukprot:1897372-Amphidinium_carterae.2
MGRMRVNPSHGVAAIALSSDGPSNMDHDFELCVTLGTRLSSWFLVEGDFECCIHVIYGFTCSEEDWATTNMELIAALRKRVEQKKGIPQMVMGGFQTTFGPNSIAMLSLCTTGTNRILDDVLLSPEVAQRFVSAEVKFLAGYSTHGGIVVQLDAGVTPDRSGWRLLKPCVTSSSNWGNIAHEAGLSPELWWKEQLLTLPAAGPRSSTQAMFEHWLSCFTSWLAIEDPKDESFAVRGCWSYFTSELGGRGPPAVQGAAWRIHILKKAVAYTKEFKAQIDSPAPNLDRCQLLASKFGKLPLSTFEIADPILDGETVDRPLATLSSSLKTVSDEQTSG